MNILKDFIADETGATAVEYGLIAALIGVGIIASMKGLGGAIINHFGEWTESFKNATT